MGAIIAETVQPQTLDQVVVAPKTGRGMTSCFIHVDEAEFQPAPTTPSKEQAVTEPAAATATTPFDPAEFLTEELRAKGHIDPTAWLQGSHPDCIDTKVEPAIRRSLINRRLRLMIGTGVADNRVSQFARFNLVDHGDEQIWQRSIREEIVPCIMTHGL
jgi:hypothetical protein